MAVEKSAIRKNCNLERTLSPAKNRGQISEFYSFKFK